MPLGPTSHPAAEVAVQVVDSFHDCRQVEQRRLVTRTVTEVGIDGGNKVLSMLPQAVLELHEVAAPLRGSWWTVAEECRALPLQNLGQSVTWLDRRSHRHRNLT